MSDLPWFRFYPSDWLAGTRGLTAAETGVYITLIAMMYERGSPLAEDYRRLARLCGTPLPTFKEIIEALIKLGKISKTSEGVFCDGIIRWEGLAPYPRPGISKNVSKEVFRRDGERCVYCGSMEGPFELDHVLPWSRGGANTEENLVVSCRKCNRVKRDRTPEEMGWAQ